MWKLTVSYLAFVLAVSIGMPAHSAAAGQRAEVELYAGAYSPREPAEGVYEQESGNFRVTEKNEGGVALGARVSVSVSRNLGIEGSFLFSPESIDSKRGLGSTNSWATALRLAVHNSRELTRTRYGFNAGVVLAGAGGDLSRDRNRTGWGGVAGVTLITPIGPRNSLRFDVEQYLYYRGWGSSSTIRSSDSLQRDLVLSVGLTFPLRF